MERARAWFALLLVAACYACSAAAPVNEQTGLELFDSNSQDGCYYNFQHYGEGDRITTNEPCLNCTCHNRMLMCYLRVCPFTKPIGQDCTVEKRGDQCCPVITCPDVPVDLLTSTSTTSPSTYGSTDVGHLDKYGCSIDGRFYSEGSKVPPNPNKPCELCYCIRNMTACVMQECTLHVDGCTPVYQKDVCCPVRYSCDHLEDEVLLLDDKTTTTRPTPGFILTTTTAPGVTQECVYQNEVFPDGALIKTDKACEHCYCMKGDIVCVVQECGTPMENEGKNCTSLPPREGQCCPDTYICEGDTTIEDTTNENELLTTLSQKQHSVTPFDFERSGDETTSQEEFTTLSSQKPSSQDEFIDQTKLGDNKSTNLPPVLSEGLPDILNQETEKPKQEYSTTSTEITKLITDQSSGLGNEHAGVTTYPETSSKKESAPKLDEQPHDILPSDMSTLRPSADQETPVAHDVTTPSNILTGISTLQSTESTKLSQNQDLTETPYTPKNTYEPTTVKIIEQTTLDMGLLSQKPTEQSNDLSNKFNDNSSQNVTLTPEKVIEITPSPQTTVSKHEYNIQTLSEEYTEKMPTTLQIVDKESTTQISTSDLHVQKPHEEQTTDNLSEQLHTLPDKELVTPGTPDNEFTTLISPKDKIEATTNGQLLFKQDEVSEEDSTTQLTSNNESVTPNISFEKDTTTHASHHSDISVTTQAEVQSELDKKVHTTDSDVGDKSTPKSDDMTLHEITTEKEFTTQSFSTKEKESTTKAEENNDSTTNIIEKESTPLKQDDKATTYEFSDEQKPTTQGLFKQDNVSIIKDLSEKEATPHTPLIQEKEATTYGLNDENKTTTPELFTKYKESTTQTLSEVESTAHTLKQDNEATTHSTLSTTAGLIRQDVELQSNTLSQEESTTISHITQDVELGTHVISEENESTTQGSSRDEDTTKLDVNIKESSATMKEELATTHSVEIESTTQKIKNKETTTQASLSPKTDSTSQDLFKQEQYTELPEVETTMHGLTNQEAITEQKEAEQTPTMTLFEATTPSKVVSDEKQESISTTTSQSQTESVTAIKLTTESEISEIHSAQTELPATEMAPDSNEGSNVSLELTTRADNSIVSEHTPSTYNQSENSIETITPLTDSAKPDIAMSTTLPDSTIKESIQNDIKPTNIPISSDTSSPLQPINSSEIDTAGTTVSYRNDETTHLTVDKDTINISDEVKPTVQYFDTTERVTTDYQHDDISKAQSTTAISDAGFEISTQTTSVTELQQPEKSTVVSDTSLSSSAADPNELFVPSTELPAGQVIVNEECIGKDCPSRRHSTSVAPNTANIPTEKQPCSGENCQETSPSSDLFKVETDDSTLRPENTSEIQYTTIANKHTSIPDQSENEIEEEESATTHLLPHIPGEGDCLVDGITYKNDSSIPTSNKCQSSCKCVSSIVKCETIKCSPPPENMINCQPMYDNKDACCPFYICDNPKQPSSIESHNQMLDETSAIYGQGHTEYPLPVTEIQVPVTETSDMACVSGNCEIKDEVVVPVKSPELCSAEGCYIKSDDDSIPTRIDGHDTTPSSYTTSVKQKEDEPTIVDDHNTTPSSSFTSIKEKEDKPVIIVVEDTTTSIPSISIKQNEEKPIVVQDYNTTPSSLSTSLKDKEDKSTTAQSPEHNLEEICNGESCSTRNVLTPVDVDISSLESTTKTAQSCSGDECLTTQKQQTSISCIGENCTPTKEKTSADIVPVTEYTEVSTKLSIEVVPTECHGNQCKPIMLPETDYVCVGEKCETVTKTSTSQLPQVSGECEGSKCATDSTEIIPSKKADVPCTGNHCDTPKESISNQACSGENCKTITNIPYAPTTASCVGTNCKTTQSECNGLDCNKSHVGISTSAPVSTCEGNNCKEADNAESQLHGAGDCEGNDCEENEQMSVPVQSEIFDVPKIDESCKSGECKLSDKEAVASDCIGSLCGKLPTTDNIPTVCKVGENCDEKKVDVVKETICDDITCNTSKTKPVSDSVTTSPAILGNTAIHTTEITVEAINISSDTDVDKIVSEITTPAIIRKQEHGELDETTEILPLNEQTEITTHKLTTEKSESSFETSTTMKPLEEQHEAHFTSPQVISIAEEAIKTTANFFDVTEPANPMKETNIGGEVDKVTDTPIKLHSTLVTDEYKDVPADISQKTEETTKISVREESIDEILDQNVQDIEKSSTTPNDNLTTEPEVININPNDVKNNEVFSVLHNNTFASDADISTTETKKQEHLTTEYTKPLDYVDVTTPTTSDKKSDETTPDSNIHEYSSDISIAKTTNNLPEVENTEIDMKEIDKGSSTTASLSELDERFSTDSGKREENLQTTLKQFETTVANIRPEHNIVETTTSKTFSKSQTEKEISSTIYSSSDYKPLQTTLSIQEHIVTTPSNDDTLQTIAHTTNLVEFVENNQGELSSISPLDETTKVQSSSEMQENINLTTQSSELPTEEDSELTKIHTDLEDSTMTINSVTEQPETPKPSITESSTFANDIPMLSEETTTHGPDIKDNAINTMDITTPVVFASDQDIDKTTELTSIEIDKKQEIETTNTDRPIEQESPISGSSSITPAIVKETTGVTPNGESAQEVTTMPSATSDIDHSVSQDAFVEQSYKPSTTEVISSIDIHEETMSTNFSNFDNISKGTTAGEYVHVPTSTSTFVEENTTLGGLVDSTTIPNLIIRQDSEEDHVEDIVKGETTPSSTIQGSIIDEKPVSTGDNIEALTVSDTHPSQSPAQESNEKYSTLATTAAIFDEHKPTSSDEIISQSSGVNDIPTPEQDTEHQSPEPIPSPGYGGEPDYEEEDQAFGPGTCRYGGKVYVSAQQIPRDDPCDFCFCFRSDIICLQQSCPPPIHGCHEEPISGFCCPRYECPVSMATTLNVTTTTTTTTTTLPPHFLPHAYKGAAQRRGCYIKGHTYAVGEVVRSSSGPCLHCTCGGDGKMKCDPKVCTPEPMLRQMIAAAVSTKRRR